MMTQEKLNPAAAVTENSEAPQMTQNEMNEAVNAFAGNSSVLPGVIDETERQALSKMEVEIRRFEHNQRLAKMFVASGLFRDIKGQSTAQTIAQAMVKIELGASMGFSPIEAMQGIDIILGRTAIGAHLRASRMQAAGYSWRFTKMDETACTMKVFHRGEELGEIGYTMEEAKRAKLAGKDNWLNNPSDMLFARAVTRAQRRFAPAALKGQDIADRYEIEDLTEERHSDPIKEASDAKVSALRERLTAA